MRAPEAFSFSCPVKINCGSHALTTIPNDMAALNAGMPMLLANRHQIGKRQLKTVVDAFKSSGMVLGIYDRITEQTSMEALPVLGQIYRDGGHDCIVAVGNGPVVNVSKCLNLLVSNGPAVDWEHAVRRIDDPEQLRPLMVVPTAGGDGNESTGQIAMGNGKWCSHRLVPNVAFIDPAVMGEPNDHDVANGALIALVNAVEAFLDENVGPFSQAYAHVAISMVLKFLPMALRKVDLEKNLCAVVNAQMISGCATPETKPGICHHLSVQLKEWIDRPLGFLMAVLLPHLVEDMGGDRSDRVGELLHPMAGPDVYAMTAQDLKIHRVVALFWEFFDAVNAELVMKIPTSLHDIGLKEEQVGRIRLREQRALNNARAGRVVDAAMGTLHRPMEN